MLRFSLTIKMGRAGTRTGAKAVISMDRFNDKRLPIGFRRKRLAEIKGSRRVYDDIGVKATNHIMRI